MTVTQFPMELVFPPQYGTCRLLPCPQQTSVLATYHRLMWPAGTVLFELAGAEAHAVAAAALKAAGARVPRACLLRRVAADVRSGQGLAEAAQAAGLRGDRLSAWALQVLFCTLCNRWCSIG